MSSAPSTTPPAHPDREKVRKPKAPTHAGLTLVMFAKTMGRKRRGLRNQSQGSFIIETTQPRAIPVETVEELEAAPIIDEEDIPNVEDSESAPSSVQLHKMQRMGVLFQHLYAQLVVARRRRGMPDSTSPAVNYNELVIDPLFQQSNAVARSLDLGSSVGAEIDSSSDSESEPPRTGSTLSFLSSTGVLGYDDRHAHSTSSEEEDGDTPRHDDALSAGATSATSATPAEVTGMRRRTRSAARMLGRKRIVLEKLLGRGAAGEVYLGHVEPPAGTSDPPQAVAVKQVSLEVRSVILYGCGVFSFLSVYLFWLFTFSLLVFLVFLIRCVCV